jgi:purine nucleosidase
MRRLLVDTDTAADDPVALVMVLRHPGVRVEAITVVAGNFPVDQGVQNALYTLELLEERVPVFRRAEALPLFTTCREVQFCEVRRYRILGSLAREQELLW